MHDPSTLQNIRREPNNRRAAIWRRIALSLMALVVIVGATGFLGVKAMTLHADGNGYSMTLTYPRVARSGLDIPWRLTVRHPGGFPKSLTIAVSNRWWDIFEFQGLHPEPSASTATSKFVYLQFDTPPNSETFSVSLDTYVQPASQVGRSATIQVIANGQVMTQAHYSTWLVP